MQCPSKEGNFSNVKKMLPVPYCRLSKSNETRERTTPTWIHIEVLPLLPEQIYTEGTYGNQQTECPAPPDHRCTQKIIFGLIIAPAAHSQAQMKPRPVCRF